MDATFGIVLEKGKSLFVIGTWDEMQESVHSYLHAYPKLMVRRVSVAEVAAYHAEEADYGEALRAAERRACSV